MSTSSSSAQIHTHSSHLLAVQRRDAHSLLSVQGASAAARAIEAGIRGDIGVMSLQELHSTLGS